MDVTLIQLQSPIAEEVNNSCIKKLYNCAYDTTQNIDKDNICYKGILSTTYLYKSHYQYLTNKSNTSRLNLNISYVGLYIEFADSEVKRVLVQNGFGDENNEVSEAALTKTSLPTFKTNTRIVSFNELPEFIKIKSLANLQFFNCSSLTSIDVSNIDIIGDYIFTNCSSLTTIIGLSHILENNCTHRLFANCTNLVFPETTVINAINVGYQAFYHCNITNVELGTNVKSLYQSAFAGCENLIHISGLENITHISAYTFDGCINLEGNNGVLDLSNVVSLLATNRYHGDSEPDSFSQQYSSTNVLAGTFRNCKKIKKIILGSITYCIENKWNTRYTPFEGCTLLHTVEINSATNDFNENGFVFTNKPFFYNCPNMTNLVFKDFIPATFDDGFSSISWTSHIMPNENGKIYVPDNLLSQYQNHLVWGQISDHIKPMSEYVPITN